MIDYKAIRSAMKASSELATDFAILCNCIQDAVTSTIMLSLNAEYVDSEHEGLIEEQTRFAIRHYDNYLEEAAEHITEMRVTLRYLQEPLQEVDNGYNN